MALLWHSVGNLSPSVDYHFAKMDASAAGFGLWLFVFLVEHCWVECNKPATFTYPLWSIMADFKMLLYFLTRKMGRELERVGVSADIDQR